MNLYREALIVLSFWAILGPLCIILWFVLGASKYLFIALIFILKIGLVIGYFLIFNRKMTASVLKQADDGEVQDSPLSSDIVGSEDSSGLSLIPACFENVFKEDFGRVDLD